MTDPRGARLPTPRAAGAAPLDADAIETRRRAIPDWISDGTTLRRRIRFRDFDAAFALVARVAALAAAADHHPDITFGWGYAEFALTTHAIGGLSDNDFTLAARIDGEAARA